VFTLQTLPACDPEEAFAETVGKVAGFSLHASVVARADERGDLGRFREARVSPENVPLIPEACILGRE